MALKRLIIQPFFYQSPGARVRVKILHGQLLPIVLTIFPTAGRRGDRPLLKRVAASASDFPSQIIAEQRRKSCNGRLPQ